MCVAFEEKENAWIITYNTSEQLAHSRLNGFHKWEYLKYSRDGISFLLKFFYKTQAMK